MQARTTNTMHAQENGTMRNALSKPQEHAVTKKEALAAPHRQQRNATVLATGERQCTSLSQEAQCHLAIHRVSVLEVAADRPIALGNAVGVEGVELLVDEVHCRAGD